MHDASLVNSLNRRYYLLWYVADNSFSKVFILLVNQIIQILSLHFLYHNISLVLHLYLFNELDSCCDSFQCFHYATFMLNQSLLVSEIRIFILLLDDLYGKGFTCIFILTAMHHRKLSWSYWLLDYVFLSHCTTFIEFQLLEPLSL